MKKTLFSLMAMCMMLVMASCGEKSTGTGLEGKWGTDARSMMGDAGQMFEKCELLMTLDGGKISMAFDMSGDIKENGMGMSLGLKVEIDGTYTATADALTANFENSSPKVDLYEFDLDSNSKSMLEAAGMSADFLKDALMAELTPENFKQAVDGVKGTMKIKQLDATTLTLADETGNEMTFTRK